MAGNKGIVSAQFYTFSAANKTITFSNDYAGLDLGEITYITNIKNGVATVIYDPFDATKGGTLSGLTLTLAYNTTTMADTDPLQIITGFTPLNADPLPVRLVEGPDDKDDTDLLNRIADNLDFLNLSLDQTEGIQVNTREANPYKKDIENALIASDAVVEIKLTVLGGQTITTPTLDTKGYQQLQIVFPSGINYSVSNIQYSSDGINWTTVYFYYYGNNATSALWVNNINGTTASAIMSPVMGRYVRATIVNSSAGSSLSISLTLRNTPVVAPNGLNTSGNINVNLATFGTSTTPVGAVQTGNTGVAAGAGLGVGSQNAHGNTSVAYPIIMGGREAPFASSLSGVVRTLLTDSQGRYILGGDYDSVRPRDPLFGLAQGPYGNAPTRGIGGIQNNIVGAQSLTVTNVAQDFGDTQVMLMRQILTELKILNQNFAEMPQMLNAPSYELSEPQEYRDNGAFDSSLQ